MTALCLVDELVLKVGGANKRSWGQEYSIGLNFWGKNFHENKHWRHSNLGHRAMGQVVFLPRPEIIYINTPFSLPRPEVIYIHALVDFSPDWRQCLLGFIS